MRKRAEFNMQLFLAPFGGRFFQRLGQTRGAQRACRTGSFGPRVGTKVAQVHGRAHNHG